MKCVCEEARSYEGSCDKYICDMFYQRFVYFYMESYKCLLDFLNLNVGVT